jgi:alpha-L-rhamnosidase
MFEVKRVQWEGCRRRVWLLSSLLLLLATQTVFGQSSSAANRPSLVVEGMTSDFSVNPLDVDDPHPCLHWTLKASPESERDVAQGAFQILVASSRAGLDQDRGDLWDSGEVHAALTPGVSYAGKALVSDTVYYWKVRVWTTAGEGTRETPSPWSAAARFQTGLLASSDWQAHWIAASADGPRTQQANGSDESRVDSVPPLPIFRHDFKVAKQVERATLFISGLGESEVFVNGRKVTSDALTPGWTDYRKTVFYDTYDVTALLHSGANAIGVMLGNGMYNVEGLRGRYTKFVGSFGQAKLIAEIHLHFADGSTGVVAADGGWKVAAGPITFSSIYGGEDYDARRVDAEWTHAGYKDDGWKQASVVDGPGGMLRAERLPPVEPGAPREPVHVTRISPEIAVYDLGTNFAGRPKIEMTGDAGSRVSILPGELVDAAGRVSQASQGASAKDPVLFDYTLRGDGRGDGHGKGGEAWTPQFSYSGFRYLEVARAGSAGPPKLEFVGAEPLHDAAAVVGDFSSSDEQLNRIHRLIDAAIQNNMVSVLTDCPTREKLGWLEQTHLAGTSILYNYDLSLLYRKMADDMRDDQLADGMVPGIAPEVVAFLNDAGKSTDFRDSPEWGSAMILSPWLAYTFDGDRQLLLDHYPAMVGYADYLQSRAKDGMIAYGLGDWYDIGPGDPGYSKLTGQGMTATAIYFQDLTALARIASILNKPADAARFTERATAEKEAINAHLFHAESDSYDRGSQTANAMALVLGLVPEGHEAGVMGNLVADIRKHNNHVTAGDIGFHYVVRALTDGGRSDVLYDMLKRTDSPSYGYQLAQGATALTEAWDANPSSSQDHFMLGHAEEWFYRGLAGIDFDLDRAEQERIWIHPQPVGDIKDASAAFHSALGPVTSRWKRDGDTLSLDVGIPAGATATVTLPAGFSRDVREAGRELRGDRGVLSVAESGGSIACVVGSGQYHFVGHR